MTSLVHCSFCYLVLEEAKAMDCDHERHERVANSSKIALFGLCYVIIVLVSLTDSAMFHIRGFFYIASTTPSL